MMQKLFFIVGFTFFSGILLCQKADSLKSDVERQMSFGPYSQNKFLEEDKGGRQKNRGKDFAMSPEAMNEYLFFKHNSRTGWILSAVGSGLMMSSVFASQRNNALTAGLFSGGCLTIGTSLVFSISAKKHFRKAIWYRNKDAFAGR